MTGLTSGQFYQVAGIYGLSVAVMLAAAAGLWRLSPRASARYRPVVLVSGLFCFIAAASYAWLCWSWTRSFTLDGGYVAEFNGAYNEHHRYLDWGVTVPLQLVAFTFVLSTPTRRTWVRAALLGLAGAEMILMGYVGEAATTRSDRWFWFAMALVPFLLITAHLLRGMGQDILAEPAGSRRLLSTARTVLLMCWPVYAIIFALQTLGYTGSNVFMASQAAYSAADAGAKVVFAIMLCRAALLKSAPARGTAQASTAALA